MSHGLITDQPITRGELLAFRDAPVHVVGAASAEGVAVLRLLDVLQFTNVTLHDMRERADLRRAFRTTHGAYDRVEQAHIWQQLRDHFDAAAFGDAYLRGIDAAALVVLPQGWYLDLHNRERLVAELNPAARIVGMTELYFALHSGPIAGVTGTNGKSTTVALIDHLLSCGGVAHETAGNERSSQQFLPRIDELGADTWALLEISNRQLLQLGRSPRVAAITALTPDHLDEHDGWAGYQAAKARLFTHQNAATDIAIANVDDEAALAAARTSPAVHQSRRLVACGIDVDQTHFSHIMSWEQDAAVLTSRGLLGDAIIAERSDVRLPGDHNLRNVAVAAAVALACGVCADVIADGLRAFAGKSLRLESMGTIDGVEVWSDIKSTTPEATQAALQALDDRARIAVIVGGDDKGLSYERLARAMAQRGAERLLIIGVPGSATDKLWSDLATLDVANAMCRRVDRLDSALDLALEWAASGDAVIVSPAAAGFWTSQLQGKTSLRSLIRQRVAPSQGVS